MRRTANISADEVYRYRLTRSWESGKGAVLFIGLNPSTADGRVDDPTIRRCVTFSQDWGFRELIMGNLFAYRATNPAHMMSALDPIGPDNNVWLNQMAWDADLIIAAWGVRGVFKDHAAYVRELVGKPMCVLSLTKAGQPQHPLYLSQTTKPVPWLASGI